MIAYTVMNEIYIFSAAAWWRCGAPIEKPPPSPEAKAKTFEEQWKQREDAEQKAALMIDTLNKDPKSKASKLQSLVKRSGMKFKL